MTMRLQNLVKKALEVATDLVTQMLGETPTLLENK
jgi:hypothetical protein